MNIDDHWLSDETLAQTAALEPSTPWGAELMREAWPSRYPEPISSHTLRNCASTLDSICAGVRAEMTVEELQQFIEGVNDSVTASKRFRGDAAADARLTIDDVWGTVSDHDFTIAQIAAALHSQLVYVARRFVDAKRREEGR
jgi:hypothetical protein